MPSLRVATWNCFGAPQSVWGVLRGRPLWAERYLSGELERQLGRFDIICVQEVFLSPSERALRRVAEACGFSLWVDRQRSRLRFPSGLALLSRYPFEVLDVQRYERAVGWDKYALKGWVTARVRPRSGDPFLLVNTHLQAGAPGDKVPQEVRAGQLTALTDSVLHRAEDSPLILCGDLNVAEGSDEYDRLAARLVPCFADVAAGRSMRTWDPERNPFLAWSWGANSGPVSRIDHIWASRPFDPGSVELFLDHPLDDVRQAKRIDSPPFASDHFGLGVELEVGLDNVPAPRGLDGVAPAC